MKNINLADFKFSMSLAMRWSDLDLLGHVNNVVFFEYYQIGRGPYMLEAGLMWKWDRDMSVIAQLDCDFYRELKLPANRPEIKIRTCSISNKSFEIEYLITTLSEQGETMIHAKGKST